MNDDEVNRLRAMLEDEGANLRTARTTLDTLSNELLGSIINHGPALLLEVKALKAKLADVEKNEKELRRILRHAVRLLELVKPQVAAWNEGDDGDLEWFRAASKD